MERFDGNILQKDSRLRNPYFVFCWTPILKISSKHGVALTLLNTRTLCLWEAEGTEEIGIALHSCVS